MGMTQGSLEAFEAAFNRGVLSCASLIVPGPWFEGAADLCSRNPGWCTGIHLCLVGEWRGFRWRPVLPWNQVSSLVDDDGFLYTYPDQLFAQKPKLGEIEAELDVDAAIPHGGNGAMQPRQQVLVDIGEFRVRAGLEMFVDADVVHTERGQPAGLVRQFPQAEIVRADGHAPEPHRLAVRVDKLMAFCSNPVVRADRLLPEQLADIQLPAILIERVRAGLSAYGCADAVRDLSFGELFGIAGRLRWEPASWMGVVAGYEYGRETALGETGTSHTATLRLEAT